MFSWKREECGNPCIELPVCHPAGSFGSSARRFWIQCGSFWTARLSFWGARLAFWAAQLSFRAAQLSSRACWATAVQYLVLGRLARLIYMFDNACSEQSTSQQPHTKGVILGVPELGPRNRSCSCGRRRVTHSWCDLVPGTDPCFCHVLFWVASPAEHRTVHEFWLCISHGSPCLQASL